MGTRISEASRVILLDPFFDDIGAEALLGRIGNQSVDFTIITSLPAGISPLSFDRLNQFLRANAHTIRPNTRIYRLVKGSLPYFHDRHLVLFGETPQPRVFNFTNSVSGLPLNYPLSMHELPEEEAGAVYSEICEPLINAANGIRPIWPLRSMEERRREELARLFEFQGWQAFLEDFLPRGHRSEDEWLDVAISQGLLADEQGGVRLWKMREFFFVERNAARLRELYLKPILEAPGNPESWNSWRMVVAGEIDAHGVDWVGDAIESLIQQLGEDARAAATKGLSTALNYDDPIPPSNGVWLGYQACINARIPNDKLITSGLVAWHCDPMLSPIKQPRFGRRFVYRLLFQLDAAVAVQLGTRLADPAILTAIDWLNDRGIAKKRDLVCALLESQSPWLRAVAAQAVASEGSPRWHKYTPQPPIAGESTLKVLQEQRVPEAERAMYGVLWAASEVRHDSELHTFPILVQSLVALTSTDASLEKGTWVIAAMVSEFRRVISPAFTQECAKLTPLTRQGLYRAIFEQMKLLLDPARIAGEYTIHLDADFMFIQVVANMMCDFAQMEGISALALVDNYTSFQENLRETEQATPLRIGDTGKRAANRLLWNRFLRVLIASCEPRCAELQSECQKLFELLDFFSPLGFLFDGIIVDSSLLFIIASMLKGRSVLELSIDLFTKGTYVPILATAAAAAALGQETLANSYLEKVLQGKSNVGRPNIALSYLMLLTVAASVRSPLLEKVCLVLDTISGLPADQTELTRKVCKLRSEGLDDHAHQLVHSTQTWLQSFSWKPMDSFSED